MIDRKRMFELAEESMADLYQKAKAKQDELEARLNKAGEALRKYDKHKNAIGLLPDSVKSDPKWKADKRKYDQAFQTFRSFNQKFTKIFRKEIRRERRKHVSNPNRKKY